MRILQPKTYSCRLLAESCLVYCYLDAGWNWDPITAVSTHTQQIWRRRQVFQQSLGKEVSCSIGWCTGEHVSIVYQLQHLYAHQYIQVCTGSVPCSINFNTCTHINRHRCAQVKCATLHKSILYPLKHLYTHQYTQVCTGKALCSINYNTCTHTHTSISTHR